MTLVLNSTGSLQQLQLGVNELASSLFVSKYAASILTRKTDANIFKILEGEYNVIVKSTPGWLKGLDFSRKFCVYGAQMRRVEGSKHTRYKGSLSMEDVQIDTLQGVASFIVLCCRYVETPKTITGMMQTLILGGIGNVDQGKLREQQMPHTMRPLLESFVKATIDADADSSQSQTARKWMADLSVLLGTSWECYNDSLSQRTHSENIGVISEILGGASMVDEMSKHVGELFSQANQTSSNAVVPHGPQHVHETLSLQSAYIALAAAANGANVLVECVTSTATTTIPAKLKGSTTAFVVRLWLCQPPPYVSKIVQYYGTVETATFFGSQQVDESDLEAEDGIISFGGQLEIALAVSRQLSYSCIELGRQDAPANKAVSLALWTAGFELGQAFKWLIKPMPNKLYPLRLLLKREGPSASTRKQVLGLSQRLVAVDKRFATAARDIAKVVDDQYLLEVYEDYISTEIIAAMKLVCIAFEVGALHTLTIALAEDSLNYALNLGSVCEHGALCNLGPKALTEGVSVQELLWAAATLWGGASIASQGYAVVNDGVSGIVAPHCVILLDILRDPLRFIREGILGKLLFMCRGSVPMLARDPATGFIRTANLAGSVPGRRRSRISCIDEGDADIRKLRGGMVITLEPDVLGPSPFCNVFCCWFVGNLAFEVDPLVVFSNILRRGVYAGEISSDRLSEKLTMTVLQQKGWGLRQISWMELLSLKSYSAEKGVVVFCVYNDPAWLICIAGCVPAGQAVLQRSTDIQWESCQIEEGDTVILCEEF